MEWAVAPFPSAVPGMKDVAYCGFDTLVIPKGCKHKEEAFAFIAYVNRQEVMEKLCNLHSKNSPLAKVSENFLEHHKNPYIKVFEELASSPNAHCPPQIPILPEVVSELDNVKQELSLLHGTPEEALAEAQRRLEKKLAMFQFRQTMGEAFLMALTLTERRAISAEGPAFLSPLVGGVSCIHDFARGFVAVLQFLRLLPFAAAGFSRVE